jgi:hypothetical protein
VSKAARDTLQVGEVLGVERAQRDGGGASRREAALHLTKQRGAKRRPADEREERTLRAVKHQLMRTDLTLFHETSGSLRIAARSLGPQA